MLDVLFHITATIISGCTVALFAHWLRKRSDK
nr:type I toxin-antitoxin system Fst family toxin [Mammaliicoccus sp. Marseille-Q6498]